jgi:plastocyanin
MRPNRIFVMLALLAVALLLAAGCTTPAPPVTPTPTATPTETPTATATATATVTGTMTMTMPETTATVPPTQTTAPATTTMPPSGGAVTLGLVARNIAYNTSSITVPACSNVTVNFDNQDSGIPHNFAVYSDPGLSSTIFKGEIITGPKTIAYTFTAPCTPGNYWFRCDVHPAAMNGRFIVV